MKKKQSFADHVYELRLRLLVWFVFFIAGSVIGFLKSGLFLNFLTKPLGEPLFYTSPMGGFNFVMQIAVFFGFVVSLPILIYQIIKFCQPVFSQKVKKVVPKLVIFSLCLLAAGLVIAFYIFIPAAIHFLKGFGGEQIQALITTDEYFSFISVYLIGMAILFQMPVIILLINYVSLLKIRQMMKWQKWMIVLSFIVAAILTPTPDPVNQTFMAAPIILLYEISIFLVWVVNRNIKLTPGDELVVNLDEGMSKTSLKNRKKSIQYYLVFLLVILILVVSPTIIYTQHKKNQKQTMLTKIDDLRQKISEADVLADNDSPKARETLADINSKIGELGSSNNQADDLKREYKNLVAKINNIIFIDQNSNVTNVSDVTDKFVVVGQTIISARENSSSLYRQTLDGKDDAKIIYSFPKGSIVSNLYFNEVNNRILAATSDDRIFNVSSTDNFSVIEIKPPIGETWPKIRSFTTFLNNIYILDGENGKIWKYASPDGITYSPKSSYLVDSKLNNKDAEAIVADGLIYLLSSDGKVSKFLRGSADKFSSPEVPKPDNEWQSPKGIFTNETNGNIYIQDSDKIVEATKLGQYLRQFVLLDKQISSAYVSQKNKTGWVLSGDKVYQFDLK